MSEYDQRQDASATLTGATNERQNKIKPAGSNCKLPTGGTEIQFNPTLSSCHLILVSRLRDTLNIRRLVHPNNLCRTIYGFRPSSSSLDELFDLRSQFSVCKAEIINSTGPQNRQAWKTCATTIHECTASLAEVIGHGRVGANGLFFTKC